MKVLLIVDVQRDFCPGGSLAVPEGDQIVPLVNSLASSGAYDLVIATKDWHPAAHVSFFDNHPGRSVFEQIALESGPQTLWPRHCEQGTPGAELHPGIDRRNIHHIVEKGTDKEIDSYSGFFDNDHRRETALRGILERELARRGENPADLQIAVCGLALDYCVAATARDAASLGYATTVLIDACRAVNLSPGDDLKTLRDLASRGVAVANGREVISERPRAIAVGMQA